MLKEKNESYSLYNIRTWMRIDRLELRAASRFNFCRNETSASVTTWESHRLQPAVSDVKYFSTCMRFSDLQLWNGYERSNHLRVWFCNLQRCIVRHTRYVTYVTICWFHRDLLTFIRQKYIYLILLYRIPFIIYLMRFSRNNNLENFKRS